MICSDCGRKLTNRQAHYRRDIEGDVWLLCELCNDAAEWEYQERLSLAVENDDERVQGRVLSTAGDDRGVEEERHSGEE